MSDSDSISARSRGRSFDNNTFVTDSSYFGNPSDVDGNGRIILLFTGEVNKLTPADSPGGFVGGFFFAGDYFPKTGPVDQSCTESNNGEIVYLLAPDPTGTSPREEDDRCALIRIHAKGARPSALVSKCTMA